MDLHFSAEQEFIRETIRKFTANECPRELARELDARAAFPADLVRRIGALGFCGLNVPEEFGGSGRDLLGTALVIQELAAVAPVLAGAFSAAALRGGRVAAEWGSAAQKASLLPRVANGQVLFTFAAEPEGAEPIRAEDEGAAFSLSGVARFVALADQADYLLTLARTGAGCTTFLVPAASPGLHITPVKKVGTRGANLGRVQFDRVAVSSEQILGGPAQLDQGAGQWTGIRALQAVEVAALGLGIAQGAFSYASGYARERVQFGRAIVSFEAVQHMLVEMATELRAAQLVLYEACSLADGDAPWALEASMARLLAVRVARQSALQSLHILGGYGYMIEYDAQRYVRDALALLEGSDSVEVIKSELGIQLGLAPEPVRA